MGDMVLARMIAGEPWGLETAGCCWYKLDFEPFGEDSLNASTEFGDSSFLSLDEVKTVKVTKLCKIKYTNNITITMILLSE